MTEKIEDRDSGTGAAVADADAVAAGAGEVTGEVEFISAERLIFFSDAVVAIAMTLLAFSLPIPQHLASDASNPKVWHALWAGRIDYLTFLISFMVIANHWRLHHRLYQSVSRLDARIVTLNMVWLLMIVSIPFTTKVISGPGGFGARFTIYAAIQVLTVLTFLLMCRHIRASNLVRADVPPAGRWNDDAGLLTVAVMFAISIPVAFVTQWAFALWVASAPAARAVLRHRDRAAAAEPATPGSGWTGRTGDRPDPAAPATGPGQAEAQKE
jgi:uncharacterized membrane protein